MLRLEAKCQPQFSDVVGRVAGGRFCSWELGLRSMASCQDNILVALQELWARQGQPEPQEPFLSCRWGHTHMKGNQDQIAQGGQPSSEAKIYPEVGEQLVKRGRTLRTPSLAKHPRNVTTMCLTTARFH